MNICSVKAPHGNSNRPPRQVLPGNHLKRFRTGLLSWGLVVACLAYSVLAQLVLAPSALAQSSSQWQPSAASQAAASQIDAASLRSHIRFLADDLLEGRGPGSRGDQLSQLYIATELESLGIQPAALDASGQPTWYQPVPLRGLTTTAPATVDFKQSAQPPLTLKLLDDMMAVSGQAAAQVTIQDAELVFVGYGIQAPEYQWNDFKDVDVRGKILVVMNNDPEDDPQLFAGKRRLYYGRWDYKYEMAAKLGAAGALIIHTTPSAGYPYQVVRTSWSGEQFELASSSGPTTQLKGWLTEQAAQRLLQYAGKDLAQLQQAAQARDFQPVPLGVKMSLELQVAVREQMTGNVLGVLPGSDPVLSREHVVFTAHHDHLGLAAERDAQGDNIYNGAIDNASGTASLLTIARAIASLPQPPQRSILFAFVGAEEQGLLGSEHMAMDPPIPAGYMAAVINIDGINFLGKAHDVNVIGNGKSNLDQVVEAVAGWQGRTVVPDHNPDRGYYYRSDQFSLAKVGVPGVYLHSGINIVGRPDGWGKEQLEVWVEKTYHQPSDEFDPTWNLDGAIEDARLLMHVGLEVAQRPQMPQWNPGDEFEAARQAAIKDRTQK
jgi:Zn-dependent M28 family amino/carboxypeptidase